MGHQAHRKQYWRMGQSMDQVIADVKTPFQVPQYIVVTALRQGMVLYSECECVVYFIEVTIPYEDAIETGVCENW